ncbi:hypothetical protein MPF19_03240 [Polaribacter sp. Z014]|uniref:hypothetical protein n=1 Tax=Polaribacter sp. Z014 TaxID=2927126 RepID=UPI0020204322|nr:hypothetical protein [Polaribacter sp. Z014]MCL7762416.1 hypothetical protein [Polaribacter sp. Z014]
MKSKFKFFVLVFLLLALQNFGQNESNKWAVTLSSSLVVYATKDGAAMQGRYIAQFPRLSLARYMFKNLTFVGDFSSSYRDVQKYTALDGEVRYDFGTSENRITPYLTVGGGFVKSKHWLPTLNFGFGGTFWVSDHFGLHGQWMYKYNEERYHSQRSHTFLSAGVVYRFSLSGNTGARGGERKRLWDYKH